ncbi:YbfB/YjiJ family MFS transporter [Magnetospirillum fulvum]|uniref:YbfB/YjiJ family MFS transporter n=1 Tax=Magnetospirillum fulvum TaxID=1082 RepID=UPI0009DBEB99|nr:YbfB/YjiJ family MFS transporter [Magnetospirillum fulvum]
MTRAILSPLAIRFVAWSALAVAMGIGRFAFTPMLPLMIRDGSLGLDASPWLAAVNYFGYLVGALTAGRLPFSPAQTAKISLVGIVLTTAAMGLVSAFPAWLLLRGLAGVLSGWALVGVSAWSLYELARVERPHHAAYVYAGVGSGIALAGLFCVAAAGSGASSASLWLELGALALVGVAAPLHLLHGGPGPIPPHAASQHRDTGESKLLIVCYGVFGFGYILPATYLPTLARQMIDDPRLFGLVWPVFGLAAALSTLCAGRRWIQSNRLRAWALCHIAMAIGAALPGLWINPATLVASAVLIGGTFMVITMLGMQEARLRAPDHAAAALGRMTAAFAFGQLAGPLVLSAAPSGSLHLGLQVAALALLLTAAPLWLLSQRNRTSP